MISRTLIVGVVGAGCIAAAGAGSYLAVKSNVSPAAAPLTQQAPEQSSTTTTEVEVAQPATAPTAAPAAAPVEESKPAPASRSTKAVASQMPQVRRTPPPPTAAPVATDKPAEPTPEPSASPVEDVAKAGVPAPEPVAAIEPAKPEVEELTVNADAVIGISLTTAVSSETAKVEDRVSARVTRDVQVDGRTVIPAGAMLDGTVTQVQRGGKFKERARLGIRFTSVTLANNARFPIQTETIFRMGEAPTSEATSKIGASAVVGAILGAVIGGKKGAVIGSTAGAAGGTAAVMASGGNEVVIAAGAPLTVRLTAPATILLERDR